MSGDHDEEARARTPPGDPGDDRGDRRALVHECFKLLMTIVRSGEQDEDAAGVDAARELPDRAMDLYRHVADLGPFGKRKGAR